MNLLFFGCLHAADKAPGGRVDDYIGTIMDKLANIARLCEEHDVKYAFSTGDLFHTKQPNRVSHQLVQTLIGAFRRFPCEVLTIAGNHDLGPDGVESLSRQPLGVLEQAGAVHILREMELLAGCHVVPRPYSAAAEGVYDGQTDPSYYSLTPEEQSHIKTTPRPVIGLTHGSLLAPGDSRQYPYVNVDKIPHLDDYTLLVGGHLHECMGVVPVGTTKGDKTTFTIFANPGSIARTRRDIASYARTVEVLVVTVDKKGLTVKEVPLPGVAPALEVFGKREAIDAPNLPEDEISRFVEVLGEGLRADQLSISDLLAELGDIDAETKAEVERLLTEVS